VIQIVDNAENLPDKMTKQHLIRPYIFVLCFWYNWFYTVEMIECVLK